jgi:N-carbamoyl-L-amino-acid hydrolase
VAIDVVGRGESAATPMDQAIQDGVRAAAEATGVPYKIMPSGGGHDAASFAQAGIPAGMVFVRNQNGSHTPLEAMRMEDFDQAATVIAAWAARVGSA